MKKIENKIINPSMKSKLFLKNPLVVSNYLTQMLRNVKYKRLMNIVIAPTINEFEKMRDEWNNMSIINKMKLRLQVILMKINYKYIILKTKISSFILLA